MKTKSLVIIAGMLAFSGVSYAEKGKKEISPELLEKYDADKDGKLSKEELAEMKKETKKAKEPKEPKEPKEAKPEKVEEKEAE